jgi:HSP20 family protein
LKVDMLARGVEFDLPQDSLAPVWPTPPGGHGRQVHENRRGALAATVTSERRIIMTIVRWDPFRDVGALEDRMSRMLEGSSYGRFPEDPTRSAWVPPVDIYSNGPHELVLKAELPDMKEEEIALTVEDNTLTLRGEKKLDTEVTGEHFHRIERSYGSFARTFVLPPTVDTGKVKAEYRAGVLTVRLPLREEAKPKQIKVEVAA